MGKPSPMAGIRVEHTLSHRLHVPEQPDTFYTAEVIIEIMTEDTLSSESRSESISGQPVAQPQNISLKEERIYELAYRSNQWQLITEFENETERLWFQYALEN